MSTSSRPPGQDRRCGIVRRVPDEVGRRPADRVTRAALLDGGSDQRFRTLVYDLLTIATRMEAVRDHLGAPHGLTARNTACLMAVAQFQAPRRRRASACWRACCTSRAHSSPPRPASSPRRRPGRRSDRIRSDGRGVLAEPDARGRQRIARVGPDVPRRQRQVLRRSSTVVAFEAAVGRGSRVSSSDRARRCIAWMRQLEASPAFRRRRESRCGSCRASFAAKSGARLGDKKTLVQISQ